MLNKKDSIKQLDALIKCKIKSDEEYDKLASVLGSEIFQARFVNMHFELFDEYIEAVSKLIGDNFEWVCWYIYENDCGKRGYEAKASKWKKAKKINTTSDLVDLIFADLEK